MLAGAISLLALCTAATAAPKKTSKAAPPKPTQEQVEQYTRLQVFLDNENFGPGKIDGHDGDFTRRALALYRRAKNLPETEPVPAPPAETGVKGQGGEGKKDAAKQKQEEKAKKEKDAANKPPPDTTGLDLQSVGEVFKEYTVTKEDAATVGKLPEGVAAQAKVKSLPYATLAEAIAEKFHCDVDFLKQLNPDKAEKLKEGDTVKVPNIKEHFDVAAVKELKPGAEAVELATNELEDAPEKEEAKPADPKKVEKDAKPREPKVAVSISTTESMLEVMVDDKLVAAYPVTIGSSETETPTGEWKVRAVAKMPNFRYDKKMLKEGERSSNFKILPPGPNNPVGIMWIALNKKGIGIHGTNDPDSIGRAASHGCIRLANWDVVKVAGLVKAGVPVKIQ